MNFKCKQCGENLRVDFTMDGSAEAILEGETFRFDRGVKEDYFLVTGVYCPGCKADKRLKEEDYEKDPFLWLVEAFEELSVSIPTPEGTAP